MWRGVVWRCVVSNPQKGIGRRVCWGGEVVGGCGDPPQSQSSEGQSLLPSCLEEEGLASSCCRLLAFRSSSDRESGRGIGGWGIFNTNKQNKMKLIISVSSVSFYKL